MALAALIVAALGLLVAALSLGWQIGSWWLDGRRVRVSLLHGAKIPRGFVSGLVGANSRPKNLAGVVGHGPLTDEVVGIRVTNPGRLRVKVTSYSVELWKGGMSFSPVGEVQGPPLPHWLEPGDAEDWYAQMSDARLLVSSTREIGRSAEGIRMSVALGTGETVKTKRHLRV